MACISADAFIPNGGLAMNELIFSGVCTWGVPRAVCKLERSRAILLAGICAQKKTRLADNQYHARA